MSDPTLPADPSPVTTTAPAVHSTELWGKPRWIHNATGEPVWVETKAEYWALLNREGFRMKDQAESTTGAPRDPIAAVPKVWAAPTPLMPQEAQILAAMDGLRARYGLRESTWCNICVQRGQASGCRVISRPNHYEVTCRCGPRIYRPPTGTSEAPATASAQTQNDRRAGTIMTADGPTPQTTLVLSDDDAALLREWARWLSWRDLEGRLYHAACWDGSLGSEMAMDISRWKIVIVCPCRTLFAASH